MTSPSKSPAQLSKYLYLRGMGASSLHLTVPMDYARQHDLAPGTPVCWQPTPDGVQLKLISPSTARRSVELEAT
jgi:hypothetical protein